MIPEIKHQHCDICGEKVTITGMSTPRGYEKMLPSGKVEAVKAMMRFALYLHKQANHDKSNRTESETVAF